MIDGASRERENEWFEVKLGKGHQGINLVTGSRWVQQPEILAALRPARISGYFRGAVWTTEIIAPVKSIFR